MNAARFDGLARSIAGGASSRRGAIRLIAGGGLLAALRRSDVAATCRRAGRTCGGRRGRCCKAFTCCRGRCRNLRTDRRFCGACGTACPAISEVTCQAGQCTCADGRPVCGLQCCPDICTCASGGSCVCPI